MEHDLDLASIHHDGSSRYVSPGYPHMGEQVHIRLRTNPQLPIHQLLLRTCPDGEQHFTPLRLDETRNSPACRWWKAELHLYMPVSSYRFLIILDGASYWYNAGGLHSYNPPDAEDFRILADYETPEWVNSSVFYQIFPDRFADGEPASNVKDGEYEYIGFPARERQWGEPPTTGSRAAMLEFYGGDLPGITSHLDYLSDLGVNALYLNPLFRALSNHRYDVTDYFNVDPHLGGNPALAALRRALDERGMRYILDIVPNHCGVMHPWFQAALADPAAPTAGYFTFNKHPHDYATWLGVRSLVKLNYRSKALREVMYAAPGSVFRHWLQPPYAADGWRIDVANMLARQGADQLGMEVGRGIRAAVKAENPQAYLIGENFFDASSQLQGDCWDGVMNYSGFYAPLGSWLWRMTIHVPGQSEPIQPPTRLTTQALVQSWSAYRAAIPWVIASQQFNLLGSHDTSRLLALLGGNRSLLRLAVTLLFTYPGVPCVYYGDEIGLGNGEGSGSRQCMSWDPATWDAELRDFYQQLIHLRRNSPALSEGGFQVLAVEQDSLVFQRDAEGQTILVVAQRGENERPSGAIPVAQGGIPDGMLFVELFTRQHALVERGMILLPALSQGAQVWISQP